MKINVFYTLYHGGTLKTMEVPHERNPIEAASLGKIWESLAGDCKTVENGPLGVSVIGIRMEILSEH